MWRHPRKFTKYAYVQSNFTNFYTKFKIDSLSSLSSIRGNGRSNEITLTVPLNLIYTLTAPLNLIYTLAVPLNFIYTLTVPLNLIYTLTVPLNLIYTLTVPLKGHIKLRLQFL